MGLLDVSDDSIRKDKLYTGAKQEVAAFQKVLERWKTEWAGAESRLQDLCKALKGAFKEVDKGLKKFPNFKEFSEMRSGLVDVAKAINEKFPENGSVKNYDVKSAAEKPDFRFI
jgi:hypothetical protein